MLKASKKRIIFSVICLIIIVPIVLYVVVPKPFVKRLIGLQRKAAKLTVKSAVVGDHTIVYSEGGTGETIIMVHGFGGNKDNWLLFAKFFTPQYHVIIPDLPGYGESTRLQGARYNIMAQVERLNAFFKGLGISQFHMVGNSMGGNISGNYAAKYPEMVMTLALFAASGVKSPIQNERQRLIEKGFNPVVVHSPADFDRYLKFIFVKPPSIPPIAKRVFAKEAAAEKSKNEKLFQDMLIDDLELEGNLSKIPQPTLILWGDTDRVLDVSSVSIFEKIRNHKKVIMKDCGHVPMIERPGETASLYLDFLKSSYLNRTK